MVITESLPCFPTIIPYYLSNYIYEIVVMINSLTTSTV